MYAFNLLLAFVCFVCFIGPHIAAWVNLFYACTDGDDYISCKVISVLLAIFLVAASAVISYALEVGLSFYTSFVFPAITSIF